MAFFTYLKCKKCGTDVESGEHAYNYGYCGDCATDTSRYCLDCGADIIGNDPHDSDCPR